MSHNFYSTVRITNSGLQLTPEQRKHAYALAQFRLMDDPEIRERLRKLQAEACIEVAKNVRFLNKLEHIPLDVTL